MSEGSYDLLAGPIFRRIRAERILLEYDDARSGSFSSLREVPDDKMVVLGLVTTKSSRRESKEELIARITEAESYVSLDRLAVSPQCGFSSSIVGNRISLEDEKYKLKTIVETGESIWK